MMIVGRTCRLALALPTCASMLSGPIRIGQDPEPGLSGDAVACIAMVAAGYS